jgi:hypothetical protein
MKTLIAILGCHSRAEYRQAQRETWIPQIPSHVDWRFFLGEPKADGNFDEVFLECPDDYNSLSKKTRAVIIWAIGHGYDRIFKCDDDTYVRPKLLLESGFEKHRYYGWTEGRLLPWPTEGQSNVVHFQWAQGGAGYWIDRECSLLLAKHMFDRDQCEDAAVGRTLYSFGIHPVHDARYWPEAFPNHREKPEPYITLHKCNPQQMREVHQRIEALKC